MADKQDKNDKGNYVLGIAVILAALLVSMTLYVSMGDLQKAVKGIALTAGAAAPAAPAAANALPTDSEIKAKVASYINTNMLGAQGLTAEITKIEKYDDYIDMVTLNIKNASTTLQQGIQIYVTKDGSSIILGGQVLKTGEAPPAAQQPAQAQQAAAPVPKANKPQANAFIMAYCPYGLQFLKAYVPVIELLGKKADVNVNFVYYAMHGEKELIANNYIYCVQKESKEKLTAYLRCFVESGDYQSCLGTAGVDAAKTTACVAALDSKYNITKMFNDRSTWLSGNYPLYPVENTLNQEYGVGGSPTLVINGVEASPSRTAESIKQAICASFNSPPAECGTALSSSQEAPGQGKLGVGATAATGAAANCGG